MVICTIFDLYNKCIRCVCRKKSSYVSSKDSETGERICDGRFAIKKYREHKFLDLRDDLNIETQTSNGTQGTPTNDSADMFDTGLLKASEKPEDVPDIDIKKMKQWL